jgi:5-methylcytosine-specific restriction endonuclease McrA
MTKNACGKNPRLRLDPTSYRELHRQVLERDGWRCQACGSMQHLQVHHLKPRSHSGSDVEHNLITLCAECHARMHRKASCGGVQLQ